MSGVFGGKKLLPYWPIFIFYDVQTKQHINSPTTKKSIIFWGVFP